MLGRIPHDPRDTGILDLGCGDGTTGYFSGTGLGYRYLGIDVSEAAIERAKRRCAEAGTGARFVVGNALDPEAFPAGGFRRRCRLLLLEYAGCRRPPESLSRKRQTGNEVFGGYFMSCSVRGTRRPMRGRWIRSPNSAGRSGTNTSGVPLQKRQGNPLAGRVGGKKRIPYGTLAQPEGLSGGTDRGGFRDPAPSGLWSRTAIRGLPAAKGTASVMYGRWKQAGRSHEKSRRRPFSVSLEVAHSPLPSGTEECHA